MIKLIFERSKLFMIKNINECLRVLIKKALDCCSNQSFYYPLHRYTGALLAPSFCSTPVAVRCCSHFFAALSRKPATRCRMRRVRQVWVAK